VYLVIPRSMGKIEKYVSPKLTDYFIHEVRKYVSPKLREYLKYSLNLGEAYFLTSWIK
jgi:hypothetical protein